MAAASVPAAVFVGVVGGLIMVIFLMLFFMMCVIGIVKQQRNKDGEGECTNNNRKQHNDLGEGLLGMVLCSLSMNGNLLNRVWYPQPL